MKSATDLANSAAFAVVASNGPEGYPNAKVMFKMENEGLKTVWFSTNTSSRRVAQFLKDPRACVYISDNDHFEGLMLVGEMAVLQDEESRRRIWREGFEQYYRQGVNDPDYSVLRFTARWGNYYHGLANETFQT